MTDHPNSVLVSTLNVVGFTPTEATRILHLLRRRPVTEAQIRAAIVLLESKGIECKDVKRILGTFPNTVTMATKRLEHTFVYLDELFGTGAAARIVVRAPTVLGLSVERLNKSIAAFRDTPINLCAAPKYFLFAPDLVVARRRFLDAHDLPTNKSTLGSSNELFAKRFGITRDRLLSGYGHIT